MKPWNIRKALFLAAYLFVVCFTCLGLANNTSEPVETAPAPALIENEYYNATVLLIDHERGLLGVQYYDEASDSIKKKSFEVNVIEVYVTNPLNQYLDFLDVKVGDKIDLFTLVGDDGKESVFDIIDYTHFEAP